MKIFYNISYSTEIVYYMKIRYNRFIKKLFFSNYYVESFVENHSRKFH